MNYRVRGGALASVLSLGALIFSACSSPNGQTVARADRDGGLFGRSLQTEPSHVRDPSGARVNPSVLAGSTGRNTRLVIDIADQRGYLLVDGKIAIDTPVSTARPGKWTPRGSFRVTERVRTGKVSTIYGVEMPYWMRLDGSVYGVHAGHLPGYPASAGCIRLPSSAAQLIYDNTSHGTRVNVYSKWDGA